MRIGAELAARPAPSSEAAGFGAWPVGLVGEPEPQAFEIRATPMATAPTRTCRMKLPPRRDAGDARTIPRIGVARSYFRAQSNRLVARRIAYFVSGRRAA